MDLSNEIRRSFCDIISNPVQKLPFNTMSKYKKSISHTFIEIHFQFYKYKMS